jgi:hypothetical protein
MFASDLSYPLGQQPLPILPRSANDAPLGILSVHFTGREKEMDFLRDALSSVEPRCCAVHGMPGVNELRQLNVSYEGLSRTDGSTRFRFGTLHRSFSSSRSIGNGFRQGRPRLLHQFPDQ